MYELGTTHMNTETKTKHKRYDEAFNKSAVEHWLLSGKSARKRVRNGNGSVPSNDTR